MFPSLASFTTLVHSPTLISGVGDNVVVAGTNSAQEQLLVRLDSSSGDVMTLSGPSRPDGEIEFYHLLPSSDGTILFDGVQFRTNEYVIGRVNVSTGDVVILSTVSGRLTDFQAF